MPAPHDHHDPLTAALDYAAKRWRVLPITPGKKHPPIQAWQNAATTDPDIIRSWWTGLYKDHGVGIATGPASGLWVLDVDDYEAYRTLERTHEELPETLTSITGSGGMHFLFAYPTDGRQIRNNAGTRLGAGLDVRGDGGQIVAAPTVHPNGTAYQWDAGQGDQPVDAPEWLLELVCDRPTSDEPARITKPHSDRPGDLWANATDWTDILGPDGWTLHHVDRRTGERHWTRPGKDTRDGTSATTGYTDNDNLKVFTSSVPHLDVEQTYTKLGYLAATHHQGDHAAAARTLAERGWKAPDEDLSGYVSGLETVAEDVNGDGETPNPLAKYVLDWPEFWSTDHTTTEWLCEPLFAAGRAHALYAGAKVGKSFLTLAACAAMATGRPFLGKPASDPIDVLYVDYEMTADDLHDRLTEFGYGPDSDLSRLHYALLPSLPPLDTDPGGATLLAGALGYSAQFVVVDTTGRATSGDENESSTFQDFYRHTGMRLKQQGIGWVRLDHAGKDAERGQRGSSAKNDDVDIVVKLIRTDTGVSLKATHRRMGWYPEQTQVVIAEDGYGVSTFNLPDDDDKPYAPGTRVLADQLDAIGVPVDMGRRKARELMREHDIKAPDAVLSDAQRYRRKAVVSNIELLPTPVRKPVDNPVDNPRATPTRHPSGDEPRATPRATSENPVDTSTRHPTRRSRHPTPGDYAPPGAYVVAPVAAPDPDEGIF